MPITIQEYAEEHVESVLRFNDCLKSGGAATSFPISPIPQWLPKIAERKLFQEYYLAVDEAGAVQGGYILKHQDFWIKDQVVRIADVQLPISKGVVDRRYSFVGVQLLRDALKRQPLLFGLGMGSYAEAVARLLKAAGWSMFSVPFFFRVLNPRAFLRNIRCLRRQIATRVALETLALSGLGRLGISGAQALLCRRFPLPPAVQAEPVNEFSAWADELWQAGRSDYGMSAVRDAETLRILYPRDEEKFIRLRVTERSRPIGWAVLLNTPLTNHKHFGNMRLGSIADCFAAAEDAVKVVTAARAFLESQNVDLIVSNQSHAAWRRGFRRAGFFQGPSNFIFASAPQLTERLRRQGVQNDAIHLNRGDGDGPINL
ncbi:MAG: hypothetical protein JXB10_09530 [Pirellulales bacterium]|nr:hypothetical protein [Pirellulales bacterium]